LEGKSEMREEKKVENTKEKGGKGKRYRGNGS
jgi:hypothetical protein